MAEIRIETSPVFIGFQHAYLVFVGDDGLEYVIRGGPSSDILPFGSTLILEIHKPIEQSEDERPLEDRELHKSRVLDIGDRSATEVWEAMKQVANAINDAQLKYDALPPQNSNSTISSVLARVGLSWTNYSYTLNSDENLGIQNYLNQVRYNFQASDEAHDDIFYGGENSDRIIGGKGSDQLYGSSGKDTLVGDEATLKNDGSVESTISDGVSDLLDGGLGDDTYYVWYQALAYPDSTIVRGHEEELVGMLDHIRDADGIRNVYVDDRAVKKFTLRNQNLPNHYAEYTSTSLGGKIQGDKIIIGNFDSTGFESYAYFTVDKSMADATTHRDSLKQLR
jgi:hypothetical protein